MSFSGLPLLGTPTLGVPYLGVPGLTSGENPMCDYPDESNVRLGVTYAFGTMVGTLTGTDTPGNPSHLLLHSPADILRYLLVQEGYGVLPENGNSSNWPIAEGQELNAPDNAICTYDTDGLDFGRLQITGERLQYHGVNIRVRSQKERIGWVKAQALCVAMDQILHQKNVTIGSDSYFVWSINRTSRPMYNGKEPGNDRHVHTINVVVNLFKNT